MENYFYVVFFSSKTLNHFLIILQECKGYTFSITAFTVSSLDYLRSSIIKGKLENLILPMLGKFLKYTYNFILYVSCSSFTLRFPFFTNFSAGQWRERERHFDIADRFVCSLGYISFVMAREIINTLPNKNYLRCWFVLVKV